MAELSLGNGYTIDLADGWTFVHALQDAVNEMQAGFGNHIVGLGVAPPGNDSHSATFSSGMTSKAVNRHSDWYYAKVDQLNGMIEQVKGMLQQYQIAETANTIQWTAPVVYDPNQDSSDIPRGHGAV